MKEVGPEPPNDTVALPSPTKAGWGGARAWGGVVTVVRPWGWVVVGENPSYTTSGESFAPSSHFSAITNKTERRYC